MNPIAELAAAIRDERARRADPRRQRVRPRRRAVRDGRLGRRRRRDRLAEGLDGGARAGDDRRLAAGLGRDGDARRCRASTSTCGRTASATADGQTPWTPAIAVVYQVDEGIRLMHAEGAERVFARHEACAAASRAGLEALGFELFADPRFASRTVTAAQRPRRPRLEGVQRRAQAPRPRPGRRPGQADRQDLPARPPRLGHGRGDPRRDRASLEIVVDRSRAGRSGPGRRSAAAQVAALESFGRRRAGRPPGRVREGPRRRARRRGGRRAPRARTTRSTSGRACRRDELCAILPDYDALIVRSQVQVDAELIAAGHAAGRSSAGPASASTTSTSRPRRGPGSSSSTPRPATRSPPPSTRSRCSTASPGGSPPADASVRRGEWKRAQFTGLELRGRTLGIVGLGKIGQAIAVRARAMEMTVLGVDPFVTAEQAANHGVELVELRRRCWRAPTSSPSTSR